MNESKDTVASSIIGFSPSTASVATEIEQLNAVVTEYEETLLSGTIGEDGFDAYYNEFMEKAEAAGLSKVKEELQSQLDTWLEENNK